MGALRYTEVMIGLIALAGLALNDGNFTITGAGQLMLAPHRQVQMVSEDLRIQLHNKFADVYVLFVFRNHGPQVEVTMGFPEETAWIERSVVSRFRTSVDGLPVETQRRVIKKDDDYEAIRVKSVKFEPQQTRVVSVSYRVEHGIVYTGQQSFAYTFKTGASWHLAIETMRVTLDWSNVTGFQRPRRLVHAGDRTVGVAWQAQGPFSESFELRNVKPDFELLALLNPGFNGIVINSVVEAPRPIDPETQLFDDVPWRAPPQLSGDQVLVTIDWIQQKLRLEGATLVEGRVLRFGNKNYRLSRSTKIIDVVHIGGPTEYVFLADVVTSLGGTYRFDPISRTAYVNLKRPSGSSRSQEPFASVQPNRPEM